MAEGVADGGQVTGAGHASGRLKQSAKHRPEGIPDDWVFDRKSRRWREPRRPGPRPRDGDGGPDRDGDSGEGARPEAAGWQANRDPAAAHMAGDNDAGPPPLPDGAADEVKDDLAALLAVVALPVGALAERRDPYCGAMFAQQLPAIVNAAVPIVARSERVVRFMTADTGGLMDWVMLAKALAPVAAAVVGHHITKTIVLIDEDEDEGQADDPTQYRTQAAA